MTLPGLPRQKYPIAPLSLLSRAAVLLATALIVYVIARHVSEVLARQNIATGFDFLWRPARFQIGESLIAFSPSDTYGRALLAALLNTLQIGVLGCIFATVVGVIAGIARLSNNPVLRRLAAAYVETFRNTPVLLQLFFWYAAIQTLPPIRKSLSVFGSIFLSQRGVQLPALRLDDPYGVTILVLIAVLAMSIFRRGLWHLSRPVRTAIMALPFGVWLAALALGRVSLTMEQPRLAGFGFQGGIAITPEFLALLTGLVLYTGAFIAEIVRGGIEAIPLAQIEASESLGLSRLQALRLVLLPQVFRIIVPPLVSEYLSLVKNSSLAVAIGYPDIVWAANAIINQTGQAIEGVLILAGVYLTLSLLTSFVLNSINASASWRAAAAGVRQTGPRHAIVAEQGGFLKGLIARVTGTPGQALITAILSLATAWAIVASARWGFVNAIWSGDGKDCRAAGAGACWAFVREKLNVFLFGLYPQEEIWRPAFAMALTAAIVTLSMMPRFWRSFLPAGWIGTAALCIWLMAGGLGLGAVPTTSWGGLPVTLMLASSALVIALPLSIALAVSRNSNSPSAQTVATGWIEIIRGVPLIALLFLANTMLPLFFPGGAEVDKLLRAQVALTVFASAYLAEAVRAGLRAVPMSQLEASQSLGLSPLQTLRLVILPQALRTALPGIINTAIGIFKDTSLVAIIGLLDLLGSVRTAGRDPRWLGFDIEGYIFAAAIYFLFCFILSRYGLWLEKKGQGKRAFITYTDPA